MNTLLVSLLALLTLTKMTCAIVCPPNICESVKCKEVTIENCDDIIVVKGGFCGCCDSCGFASVIPVGRRAEYNGIGSFCGPVPNMDVPLTIRCAPGLLCDSRSSTCILLLID